MPFKKGMKKTGGRIAGVSRNKITRDVTGLLDKLKCNPVEGLAKLATDPKVDVKTRAYCYSKLAQFTTPTLQSVTHLGPSGGPIQHEHGEAKQRLKDRANSIRERLGLG